MTLKQMVRGLRKRMVVYKAICILNPLFDLFTGGKKRPIWFDIDKTCPPLRQLEQHFPVIRAELDGVLACQDQIPRYHEIDYDLLYASGRYNRNRRWNVFMLFCYGAKPADNRALCPQTCRLLEGIPGMCQAFFSILDPGKSIPLHTSPSRYYLRYHLALQTPRRHPPHIQVGNTSYTWREGESMMFDDSWEHEIINHADTARAVLIVDILRPLPAPIYALSRFICWVARWAYARPLMDKLKKFPLLAPSGVEPGATLDKSFKETKLY